MSIRKCSYTNNLLYTYYTYVHISPSLLHLLELIPHQLQAVEQTVSAVGVPAPVTTKQVFPHKASIRI